MDGGLKTEGEKKNSTQQRFSDSGSALLGFGAQPYLEVPIELVVPNPKQPRKVFSDKEVLELSSSLERDGFLQPLVVLPKDERGTYFLLAGERRWRAARVLGLSKVPVIVKKAVASDVLRLALVENLQRQDLGVVEEGMAYQELIKDHGYTHEKCGEVLGVDRTRVTNAIRILTLPEAALSPLVRGDISMGHARSLLALKEAPELLKKTLQSVLTKGLSVRQTEALCQQLKKGALGQRPTEKAAAKVANPDIEYYEDLLRQRLKTKVRLFGAGARGKIEISYFSAQEFERLLGLLRES